MCTVSSVSPESGSIDDEGTVGTHCTGLRGEGFRTVHIADDERTGGAEYRIGFGQVRHVGAEYGRIVGAKDVDDDTGRCAIGTGHTEGIGVGGTGHKLVVCTVSSVSPEPGSIDNEGTVGTGYAGRDEGGFPCVQIGDGERAGGADVSGRVGLGQVRHVGAEYGRVVDPVDPYCRGSPTERTVTQPDRVSEAIRQVPARSKTLKLGLEGVRQGGYVIANFPIRSNPDFGTVCATICT